MTTIVLAAIALAKEKSAMMMIYFNTPSNVGTGE
jgi:hypothetical protein